MYMKYYCLKRLKLVFLLTLVMCFEAMSQEKEYPKIGDTVPSFLLKDLHYYTSKNLSSDVFKGKPFIIDFFYLGCEACFASFPELNTLKKEFEGQVQFILIGKNSPGLQKQYEIFMKHYNLSLPVDYDDSTIWNLFGVTVAPYTVWVDKNGIIKQTTTTFALTKDRINTFLQGKSQSLAIATNQKDDDNAKKGMTDFENFYDNKKPFLMNGNGGTDSSFLYRSIFSKWDYRSSLYRDLFISTRNKNRIQEIGVNLNILFNLAYGDTVPFLFPRLEWDPYHLPNHYGQWATYPVFETGDSLDFFGDLESGKNEYSYSLITADSNLSALKLQHIMQRDLANYLDKEATVERRLMPCWKIVASKNAEKLCRTKGGKPLWEGTYSSFHLQNQPVSSLLAEIWSFYQTEPIFIDDTHITYNIDLKIDAVLTDISDIQKALQKNGLALVKSEKEMNVIVVRDAKN